MFVWTLRRGRRATRPTFLHQFNIWKGSASAQPRRLNRIARQQSKGATIKPIKPPNNDTSGETFSELAASQQTECLKACRELTDAIYEGLDLQVEIRAVAEQKLGDTVLLWDNSRLIAFAVCHCGAETEAGNGTCYVKFGAARTAESFDGLLDACESLARKRGLTRLEAGVNLAREDAYQRMMARGFRTDIQGVAMHRPNKPGHGRADAYVMDDWR